MIGACRGSAAGCHYCTYSYDVVYSYTVGECHVSAFGVCIMQIFITLCAAIRSVNAVELGVLLLVTVLCQFSLLPGDSVPQCHSLRSLIKPASLHVSLGCVFGFVVCVIYVIAGLLSEYITHFIHVEGLLVRLFLVPSCHCWSGVKLLNR